MAKGCLFDVALFFHDPMRMVLFEAASDIHVSYFEERIQLRFGIASAVIYLEVGRRFSAS